jgi:hypothetical protein
MGVRLWRWAAVRSLLSVSGAAHSEDAVCISQGALRERTAQRIASAPVAVKGSRAARAGCAALDRGRRCG